MLWTPQDNTSLVVIDFEHTSDTFRARFVQNDRPIRRFTALMRKYSDELWNAQGELKHIARVPLWLWLQWERDGITEDDDALLKALELHSEYKTTTKRI